MKKRNIIILASVVAVVALASVLLIIFNGGKSIPEGHYTPEIEGRGTYLSVSFFDGEVTFTLRAFDGINVTSYTRDYTYKNDRKNGYGWVLEFTDGSIPIQVTFIDDNTMSYRDLRVAQWI